jgi:archaemetzincin
MKRILYIWALMLSAVLVASVLQAPVILWAESMNLDSDFERMGEPKPGEWLFHHYEPGQSFEDYVRSSPVRASGKRRVLVFQPVGPLSDEEEDIIRSAVLFAGLWFDLPTRVEPAVPLPQKGWHRLRHFPWQDKPVKQYRTDYFLHELLPGRLPEDAVCFLAITMADLYPDDQWNFVFGQASLSERVGVYSMARYFPKFWGEGESMQGRTLPLKRSCKVLVHEVGHIFGLKHCIDYRCAMNASNSLEESDQRPLWLCPVCLKKLQWNRGLDVISRYEALKTFYEKYDLNEEAAWVTRRLEKIANNQQKKRQ